MIQMVTTARFPRNPDLAPVTTVKIAWNLKNPDPTPEMASQGNPQAWHEAVEAGLDILIKILELDSPQEEDERFDGLLNEGLRSNGPFYGFGALLSRAIVKSDDRSKLGIVLGEGAPVFIEEGFRLLANSTIILSLKLADTVHRLRKLIAKA